MGTQFAYHSLINGDKRTFYESKANNVYLGSGSDTRDRKKNMKLSSNLFPVVGIGASAGGLDAFKRFVKAIPEKSGIAYILVQHLEPSHESLLADLLQKATRIPIQEITNNVLVEPDRIYIIPSNKLLMANDGRLQLSPRPPKNERNMPIDVFFMSLAEVHQAQAIGVVLSGTATDGTLGLKEIKDHGGYTFAQQPQSATFPGMPQSAIDAEVADFILAPEDMPLQLVKLSETFKKGLAEEPQDEQLVREGIFREILYVLRIRKATDFTYYKQTTIRRRIIRRIGLSKMENLADYLNYFRENVPEQDLLYQDLLIPVTGFFRDPKVFDELCEVIFPDLLKDKDHLNPLRIWVAGCSTGEEPYSMAICLHEHLRDRFAEKKIQIFATDISERSVVRARSGIYTKREMVGLSDDRQQKYFTKINGGFHVNKLIRDTCVFARHNFLKDAPFAKMDLVSCRNVLIYMESFLQKKALSTFHYALNANGYLLLGHSETASPSGDLFTAMDKHNKLFTRKAVPGRFPPINAERKETGKTDTMTGSRKEGSRDDFQRSTDEILLTGYTPPGVVVNEQFDIVQFRGSTGAWLEPSSGKPSLNIMKMAREGLAFELRNTLHKSKVNNRKEVKECIPVKVMGKQQWVTIEVIPLSNTIEPYFLILFKETPSLSQNMPGSQNKKTGDAKKMRNNADILHIQYLEKELAQLREDMRSITEDQETVNEELQSANEELLSGSEEFQSLNEELETSKEEIQSTNEELTTLNHELFDRNDQLNLSRLYAESIIATIREPFVVLDRELKVRTANSAYYKKFNALEEGTEGKSFFSLGNGQWDIPELHELLDNIRTTNVQITDFAIKHKIDEAGERDLLINAGQIFRKDHAELMILLAFEDVTTSKKREDDLILSSQTLEMKVAERTHSLNEANISLKQSNDNLDQFATIASHDLQEPLRKIRTFAAILNQRHGQDIEGEAKELLRKITVSAERMSVLIHDVLNFSKVLDASVFERTDLNAILDNVMNDFDLMIAQKGAVINHEPLPVIKAVPLQMNQLFYNLLGNALKFSKADLPPMIDISSAILPSQEVEKFPALDSSTPYCEIVFGDNGIGVDPRFSDQIFLIFQRLNARQHFEGTGIGLALCKRIVMNHHGEIYVNSNEGMGSKFHIILPIGK